ncbi:MAG TPA: helix-turn-helix transcriptional regulator [Acidobacteriota bacterium]|nr:helix-turn-helix transcriptional regulator [Acidobacteriota bacterium]
MSAGTLGELEHILLLAVMRLGEGAYGVRIRQEILERTGRSVALGAIYPTMDRLEAKGYVSSRRSEPTPERGGRAKRLFRLEPDGVAALERGHEAFMALWEGFEPGAVDR